MPGRDGSGPLGAGYRTGRGLGVCNGYSGNLGGRRGCGFGRSAGYGVGRVVQTAGRTFDEMNLKEYQIYLEEELKRVKLDLEGNK